MAHVPPKNFVTWNNRSPLIPPTPLVVWGPILVIALNVVPKFTGECHKTPKENLQDIASVCTVHGITKQHVALRLLIASFKGRALDWFRSLGPITIADWDQLGNCFFQRFSNKADKSSLMHQFITIKRAPQGALTKFNLRFLRTWQIIPLSACPPAHMAFIFYLKALNSDISVMIQSLGGNTLPQAFDIVVQSENNMIDVGKLAPRPIMLVFPEISHQTPEKVIPNTSTPQSMYVYPGPSKHMSLHNHL